MSECATCGTLGDHVAADLEAGEALPPAVSQLEAIAGGDARRCPTCRALFLYTYDYEYGALGDGWETATVERVERDRVLAVLLASPPSDAVSQALEELGVVDGEAAIMTKLLADLGEPAASYAAVRKLVTAFVERADLAAIERLLRHPRAKVRADTLYQLQTHRGSLILRAVAASPDPSPTVREAATTAAFVAPPRDVGLEPAITACLDDPDEEVRGRAAWALAVFAEDRRDVSMALAALARRVTEDPSREVRTTAARALVGAAAAGADCASIVSVVERLDSTDALRSRVLDAIRTEAPRTQPVEPTLDAAPRETPIAWLLEPDEVAALWALGVPLDAACVPDDQLRLAIAHRRVKLAWSWSSMGTAETYWALARPGDGFARICVDGVVMPPGQTAQETPFEDRADDRDVQGVLWAPFFREQHAALARSLPPERRPMVLDAYARVLADLEERWAKGPKRIERAPFVAWLRTDGPIDTAELERWLAEHTRRSVRHLVQGIRARWISQDVMSAAGAVLASVERFEADRELQRATRIELLRAAARVLRSR